MNKAEALEILGLNSSANEEDIKKSFRKLAYSKHPDRNKEPGAEDEYKKISAAYEYLKNPPEERVPQWGGNPGTHSGQWHNPWRDFFGGGFSRANRTVIPNDVHTQVTISFKESVLGCKKTITINKGIKCEECDGSGGEYTEGMCTECNGEGVIEQAKTSNAFTTIFRQICKLCQGDGRVKDKCNICHGSGSTMKDSKITVSIPPGVFDGVTIRLQNSGNYYKNIEMDRSTHVFVRVLVIPDKHMKMSGKDVISHYSVSLYDALGGAEKQVTTLHGKAILKIKPQSRHTDQVRIKGHGVGGVGDHVYILDVTYPADVSKILDALQEDK